MNILLCYGYHTGTTGFYFQRAFSREHCVICCGPAYGFERPGYGTTLDVAEATQHADPPPDLFFYVTSGVPCFPLGLDRIEAPTVGYLIDVHLQTKHMLHLAQFFDYVFIAQRDYVTQFQQVNPNTFWLPLACDTEIHKRDQTEKVYEVGFVGHWQRPPDRLKLLNLLSRDFMMNDFRRYFRPEEMARVYTRSKIVFNKPVNGDLNMRVFEAMACGSLLVTQRIQNGQEELFHEGKHLVTYNSDEEAVDAVRYYLDHSEERERIAEQGYQEAVSKHTYLHRAQKILETVSQQDFGPVAPIRAMKPEQVLRNYLKVYGSTPLLEGACDAWSKANAPIIWKSLCLPYVFKTLLNRLRAK
jgi:hypothetical protein